LLNQRLDLHIIHPTLYNSEVSTKHKNILKKENLQMPKYENQSVIQISADNSTEDLCWFSSTFNGW